MNSTRLRIASASANSSSLTILQAQPRIDESTYECALVSLSTQSELRSHHFELRLLVPPRLAPFEFPRDAQVGMKVLLTCSALEGHQPISFIWLKDQQIIMSGASLEGSVGAKSAPPDTVNSLAQLHRQQLAEKLALSAHAALELGPTKSEYVLITSNSKSAPFGVSNDDDEHSDYDDDDADNGKNIVNNNSANEHSGQSHDKSIAVAPKHDSSHLQTNRKLAAPHRKSSMHLIDSSIRIRQADDFSILSIDSIELKHSGRYSCSAQNEAARVQHSSQLIINGKYPAVVRFQPIKDSHID